MSCSVAIRNSMAAMFLALAVFSFAGIAFAKTAATPPPTFKSVFVVVEENHSYDEVVGNVAEMPYFNGLISQYALATNFYANHHPSIGNYFTLTTGKGITNNDDWAKTTKVNNVVRVLEGAGISWKVYIESLPADPINSGDTFAGYIRHHDPFVYFTDVINNLNGEQTNLVDSSQLATDISNDTLPQYGFIVPNANDDGRDTDLATTDAWLQANIDPLITSAAFQSGPDLLIITWDESVETDKKHGGGHIPVLIVSPLAKPGFVSTTLFKHQNTLRLMLDGLGIDKKSMPGAAKSAKQMGEFFQ